MQARKEEEPTEREKGAARKDHEDWKKGSSFSAEHSRHCCDFSGMQCCLLFWPFDSDSGSVITLRCYVISISCDIYHL